MGTPIDREYTTYARGEVREMILGFFREGLRSQPDPETGDELSENTIRQVTARGGRFYNEADGVDLVLMGIQKRDEYLAQQLHIDRAGSEFLRSYHAPLWGEEYLPAFGGSGFVAATGTPGTIWQGSTTVPDPFAVFGTDSAGRRYQVLITGQADGDGNAMLYLAGIDGGDETNIDVGSVIRWANPPGTSAPEAIVTGDRFDGGLDAETDQAFAARLAASIRHKPAAGNWSHIRSWARQASVSVEDAFVYSCAFHAGSVLVAIVKKRGDAVGPGARIPDGNVLSVVTTMLVPPASPVLPGRAHVVVVPPVPQSVDLVVELAQSGWVDRTPFPQGLGPVTITLVSTQSDIRITAGGAGQLPLGVAGPLGGVHLMVWASATSAFVQLDVSAVTDLGAGVYRVQLVAPPAGHTLAVGDWVSPGMQTASAAGLAQGVSAYFDSLGPGEVINLATDERAVRAYRQPIPSEEYPARAGQGVLGFLTEALGSVVSDLQLGSITPTVPAVPVDPILGPTLLVAGRFAVYPLD